MTTADIIENMTKVVKELREEEDSLSDSLDSELDDEILECNDCPKSDCKYRQFT